MSKRVVLDAWAMLALLQGEEPAASDVRRLLQDADGGEIELLMSIINLGEVTYRVGKVKGEEAAFETLAQMRRLPITVVAATEDAVLAAVRFKIHHAISYADAFAAATADSMGAVLATGDPELVQIEGRIAIQELVRKRPHRQKYTSAPGGGADPDAAGAGVQVNAVVEVDAAAQADVAGEAETHVVFNGDEALQFHDEAVGNGPQANAGDGRDPAQEGEDGLLPDVARQAGGLAGEVEGEGGRGGEGERG